MFCIVPIGTFAHQNLTFNNSSGFYKKHKAHGHTSHKLYIFTKHMCVCACFFNHDTHQIPPWDGEIGGLFIIVQQTYFPSPREINITNFLIIHVVIDFNGNHHKKIKCILRRLWTHNGLLR